MKRRLPVILISVLVFILTLVSCASSPGSPGLTGGDGLSSLADMRAAEALRNKKISGGIVLGVYSRGEVLVSRGYGYADISEELLLTGSTPMPIGSVTKTFTALAVMQLVENDLVRLEDPLSLHLKDLSLPGGAEGEITVEMLLTHRGGIQGDILIDFITREQVDPSEFQRRILGYLADRPMLYEPGKRFSYSNAGFALLGILVEEKSGMSYSDYIRRNIFEPAGMEDSLVYPAEKEALLPIGYGLGEPLPPPQGRDMAAGSLLVSSRDMMKFVDALFSGKIVREETWQHMIRPHNEDNPYDRSFSIGLGYWLINPLGTEDLMAAHGGDLPPFQALLVLLPDRKSAVFVAANDMSTGQPLAMSTGITLLKDLIQYEEGVPLAELQTALTRSRGFAGDITDLAGLYNTVVGPMEVTEKKGNLAVTLMGMKLHLVHNDLGWWKPQVRILGIPLKIAALEALSLDLFTVDGEAWVGLWSGGIYGGSYRMIDPPGKPEEFASRAGTWQAVDETQVVQEIKIKAARDYYLLSFDFIGNPISLILKPEGPDLARTAGEGRFVGDLLEFHHEGDSNLLEYSGQLFRKAD